MTPYAGSFDGCVRSGRPDANCFLSLADTRPKCEAQREVVLAIARSVPSEPKSDHSRKDRISSGPRLKACQRVRSRRLYDRASQF